VNLSLERNHNVSGSGGSGTEMQGGNISPYSLLSPVSSDGSIDAGLDRYHRDLPNAAASPRHHFSRLSPPPPQHDLIHDANSPASDGEIRSPNSPTMHAGQFRQTGSHRDGGDLSPYSPVSSKESDVHSILEVSSDSETENDIDRKSRSRSESSKKDLPPSSADNIVDNALSRQAAASGGNAASRKSYATNLAAELRKRATTCRKPPTSLASPDASLEVVPGCASAERQTEGTFPADSHGQSTMEPEYEPLGSVPESTENPVAEVQVADVAEISGNDEVKTADACRSETEKKANDGNCGINVNASLETVTIEQSQQPLNSSAESSAASDRRIASESGDVPAGSSATDLEQKAAAQNAQPACPNSGANREAAKIPAKTGKHSKKKKKKKSEPKLIRSRTTCKGRPKRVTVPYAKR
jgi:hypothetical protein